MLKPIPRIKLPHVVTYKGYAGNTGEKDTYDTAITLKYVKVEERKQYIVTNNGRELIGNALMFYDYINSTGLINEPINNSTVDFNGHVYHVVDTEILRCDSSLPHHYEVMLK